MLGQLQEQYPQELRIIYRHYPLSSIHPNARISAEAAESAGAQGKFWEYHDLLFVRQNEWAKLPPDQIQAKLVAYAAELGLDGKKIAADLEAGTYKKMIEAAEMAAQAAGLTGTPTIAIDSYLFPLEELPLDRQGLDVFAGATRLVQTQFDSPKQVIDPSKAYEATVKTEKGDIVFKLYPDTAPVNVNSFVFLAQNNWYDGVTFHRVIPGFMAQGGDPTGLGIGWPGYRCDDEVAPTRQFDRAGLVAMANSGANTNSAQFFITYGPAAHLNEGFTIIGEVIKGQEVVEKLLPRNPDEQPRFLGDRILKVTVTEK